MLDQQTFDRTEEISDALHAQAGIENALIRELADVFAQAPGREQVIFALIAAQKSFRSEAMALANQIARSGKERTPNDF